MAGPPDPDDIHRLAEKSRLARMGFLQVELNLSRTFTEIARVTGNPETAARNCGLAQQGYDTVLRFYRPAEYEEQEQQEIEGKLEDLRERLAALTNPSTQD